MKRKKYITIFCSSSEIDEKYIKPTKILCKELAKKGFNLVWGGTDFGLMKIVADEFEKQGKELIGITLDPFKHKTKKTALEMILAPTLAIRIETMINRGDIIMILPGGLGTLNELAMAIEFRKIAINNKPTLIFNIEGFYNGLKDQLEIIQKEGFIQKSINDLVFFANTSKEAMRFIERSI